MTKLEALNQVEALAAKVGIKDPLGEPLTGIETLGIIARRYPILDQIQEEFFIKNADPLWYFQEAAKIIHFFKEQDHKRKRMNPKQEIH